MIRVLLVRFGRGGGGEGRRVESWNLLLDQPHIETEAVDVLERGARPRLANLPSVVRGRAVPEALAWSPREVRARADAFGADIVLAITARAFAPAISSRPTLLDLVDPLEVSYRQRATLAGRRGIAWRALARSHVRFTAALLERPILAGRADAEGTGAAWIPNVLAEVPDLGDRPSEPEVDLVFFGSLGYPPNVDAVLRLERLFGRSTLRVLIAGRAPTNAVREAVRRCGWRLLEDYPSVQDLAGRAHLAVAPLRATAGLQNKVLEAAAAGLPQVVTPESLRGFAPGFPVPVGATDAEFVRHVERMLADPSRAAESARAAHAHVAERYVAASWRPVADDVLRRRLQERT